MIQVQIVICFTENWKQEAEKQITIQNILQENILLSNILVALKFNLKVQGY